MNKIKLARRSGAALLALAAGISSPSAGLAQQQPSQNQAQEPSPIGPPQLRDFQLTPRGTTTRPSPAPAPAPQPAQTAPVQPRAEEPAATAQPSRPLPTRQATPSVQPPLRSAAPPAAEETAPTAEAPAPAPVTSEEVAADTESNAAPVPAPAPAPAEPVADASAAPGDQQAEGTPLWLYLVGGLGLGLLGYLLIRRRRTAAAVEADESADIVPVVASAIQPQAPRAPRPDPVPRPWLEIEITPERTTADPEESTVEFEMVIRNNGGSPARNVRLQAKLICSTPDQDKEIAAFHRKRPGEHRTLDVPDLAAGQELRLKGRVDAKGDDLKALRMNQRLIWVPLVAVNAFYEWGVARAGQTSKSFLVGREQPDSGQKMAPFRLDLGPRVYRTVGQRPYKIERRV